MKNDILSQWNEWYPKGSLCYDNEHETELCERCGLVEVQKGQGLCRKCEERVEDEMESGKELL